MKKRLIYAALTVALIVFALYLRSIWRYLPYSINFWIGDFLWAVMLYCASMAIFAPSNKFRMTIALVIFCWIIECSQAWHEPWLDAFRNTTIGGLLLGHGFLWSDMIAYTAGILVAYWVDKKGSV